MPWSHLPYTLTHEGSTKVVLPAAFASYWSVYITVRPVDGRRVDLINNARQAFLRRRTLPLTFIWFHFNVWEVWSITLWYPWVEEFSLTVILRTGYHFSQFWAVQNNYCILCWYSKLILIFNVSWEFVGYNCSWYLKCILNKYLNRFRKLWLQCYLLHQLQTSVISLTISIHIAHTSTRSSHTTYLVPNVNKTQCLF